MTDAPSLAFLHLSCLDVVCVFYSSRYSERKEIVAKGRLLTQAEKEAAKKNAK